MLANLHELFLCSANDRVVIVDHAKAKEEGAKTLRKSLLQKKIYIPI